MIPGGLLLGVALRIQSRGEHGKMPSFQQELKSFCPVTTAPKGLHPHGTMHLVRELLPPHSIQSIKFGVLDHWDAREGDVKASRGGEKQQDEGESIVSRVRASAE